ncbi:aspartate/glutamate racemase family protein [Variovorax sp. Sphag1AA]|uniref:aspartate/glutamate racemase family protein n=1 Tax=Variovorax sp. Sphag1AA TaxID=2587027 RepID=UPI00160E50B3|nr:aspartate/glutamate racemase family protein [Variovorax sp. Sphag1AA]MBB3180379.1 Asp/Glu/hydantoin racemase [Variovorax sp. Sphag1AA]
MARLLVINPNTSGSVSDLLQRRVSAAVGGTHYVRTVTARFGAPYIASEASYAVAQHATLDAWAAAHANGERPDAVLIGCFGDPGLFALREGAGVAVGGLAEASFIAGARRGRFAVVTGGEAWRPMLERLAWSLGYSASLAGIHTVAPTGAQLAADPQGARSLLAEACRDAAQRFGVEAVVLGGAGLAGIAAEIADAVPVPLIDSVDAGAAWALEAVGSSVPGAKAVAGFGVAWQSVSWELESFG